VNNYDLVRPLLATVEHRPVLDALAAYDSAVAARAEHRPPGERRKSAEAALRAEHLAAALEQRAPTLTAATLTAADEAAVDDQLRTDALDKLEQRRMLELDAAIAAGAAHVWHALAVGLQHDDSALDAASALWGQLQLPALYAPPGLVGRGGFSPWYPPALQQRGVLPGSGSNLAAVRQLWDQHLHSEMALPEGRGWRMEPDGSLRLLTPWPPGAPMRPALPDDPDYVPPNVHRVGVGGEPRRGKFDDGDLVWIGRGPNGERGVTLDDITGGLQPAGFTW
jgi:hypothetical protein